MNPSNDGKSLLTGSLARKQIAAYLANFAESALDAIVAFDKNGQIVYWNPAAEKMFGWKANEVLGMKSASLSWHGKADNGLDELERLKPRLKRGEIIRDQCLAYPRDNSPFWVESTLRAIPDENGKPSGYLAVYHDISAYRQEEEALQSSREYFEEVSERLSRLQKVTAALSGTMTVEQVAKVIVDQGVPALGAIEGAMILLTGDDNTMESIYSIVPEPIAGPYYNFPLSLNIPVTDAVRTGQIIWIESRAQYLERYPHLAEQIEAWGHQAAVSVPLVVQGRTSGVFALSFDQDMVDSPGNREFFLTLARQASLALERAQFYQAEQQARKAAERAAEQMSRLQKVAVQFSESLTREQVAKVVVDQGVPALEAVNGSMVLLAEDGESLQLLYTFLPETAIRLYPEFSLALDTPITNAIRTGQTVWIGTQKQYKKQYPHLAKYIVAWQHQATVAVPLVVKGSTVGAFALSFDRPLENIPENQHFIMTLARQGAQALERAQLYQEEQQARQAAERAADRTNRLQQITATLARMANPDQLAAAVIQQAVLVTGANAGFLAEFLESNQELRTVAAIGYPPGTTCTDPGLISAQTPLSDCVRTGQAIWVRSREELAGRYPSLAEKMQNPAIQSLAAIPLRIGYKVLGGMVFEFVEKREFEKEDQEFFKTVGQQCAQGFERARSVAALSSSEERFNKAFHASPNALVISHLEDGRIETVNDTFVKYFGYSNEEVIGKTSLELGMFVNPLDRQEAVRRMQTDGAVREFEIDVRLKSGDIRTVSLSTETVSIGGKDAMLTAIQDVTERQLAVIALRRSEEKYRTLFETIDEGFCIIEVIFDGDKPIDYRFLEFNPAFERHTGLVKAEGRLVREMVPGHEEHWFQIYGFVATTGEPVRFENEARALGRIYDVYAFRVGEPEQRRVAVLFNDITQRKQMEQALLKSRERYATLFNSVNDGFAHYKAVYNEAGKLVDILVEDINPSGARLSGVDREAQIGKTWKQIWPGVEDSLFAMYEQVDQTGQPNRFEHLSGITGRIYQSSINRIVPGELVAVFSDITDRKQAEQALLESKERYQHLVKYAPSGIYEIDVKSTRIKEVNDIMCEILGYTREELLSMLPEELLDEESGKRFQQRMLQTMAGEKVSEQVEYKVKTKDGREIWAILNTKVNYEHGQPSSISVIAHDITERKHAEESLRESEERLRKLIDTSPISIGFGNSAGKIFGANEAFYRLTGYSREEIEAGQVGWDQLTAPEYAELDRQIMEVLDATGSAGPYEKEYIRKDGSRVSLLLNVSKLPGRDEHIAFINDITERKLSEDRLAHQSELLQGLFDNIPVLLVMWDPALQRFTLNRHAEKVLGWTTADANNGNFMRKVYPDPAYREKVSGFMQSLGAEFRELFTTAKDGENIPIDWANIRLADDTMIGIGVDLRERKRAEASLRARTEEIATLLDVSPIGIFVAYDPACKVITTNPAGYKLVESPANGNPNVSKSGPEGEKLPYHVFRNGVELSSDELPMQKAARLGIEMLEDSLELRFEDGSRKYIYSYTRPLMDEKGNPRGAISAMLDITGQKWAEEQLARSNRRLNEILTSIQDDFYVLDQNWVFIYANKQFTGRIGKEPEDFIGNNIWEMFPKHVGTYFEENLRAAMEKREVRRFEVGEKYTPAWYRMTAFPSAEGITVLGTDVTVQKRAEEQLRYQAALLSNVSDAVVASDAEYRITIWNSGAEALYGWKAEEVMGRRGLEIVRTEWPEKDAEEMRRTIAETGRWRGEATQVRRDGSRFPVDMSSMVLFNDEGHVTGYVSVNRDITERKKTEMALRESEERFRSLANAVPAIVWTSAPDGTILFTNEFWHTYTGSKPEETGSDWAELLHPDDTERGAAAWKDATEKVSDYLLESRIRRYDGEYRWFQARATPIRDAQGNVTAWYGVSVDIHDRIEAVNALRDSQQKLQFLNENLEQKVNEQTAELRSLTSNLTKAEQRERQRIAHILHEDLQQRLYAVKLKLAFLPEEVKKLDPVIETELVEMNQQLQEILSLTRSLTVELSPPILHDEGLTQALSWLASQMREKQGLQIEIQAEESFALPDEAVQVLLFNCVRELLFNIVKHAGTNRATVSLQRLDGQLQIEVRDEGKGFDVSVLTKDNRDDDELRHSSFGLPTLRHQLGLLGGTMDIQSEPDAGTCITITIPYS